MMGSDHARDDKVFNFMKKKEPEVVEAKKDFSKKEPEEPKDLEKEKVVEQEPQIVVQPAEPVE